MPLTREEKDRAELVERIKRRTTPKFVEKYMKMDFRKEYPIICNLRRVVDKYTTIHQNVAYDIDVYMDTTYITHGETGDESIFERYIVVDGDKLPTNFDGEDD